MVSRVSVQTEFQSQNGSIRRREAKPKNFTDACFNPKLVRLEVGMSVLNALRALGCFNPKLVRLEATRFRLPDSPQNRFNPKMVRLEVYDQMGVWTAAAGFQSQNGSIRSAHNVFDVLLADTVSIPKWFD